ncbi:MAG TPA: hypothetical protein VGO78_10870 [Acidimicrobiales bacterium]|nr:hypothetical protein [Acidimicrobiales bacterium]
MAAASTSRRRQGLVEGGWIALLIALVPLVTAAVRAIRSGWVPVGDAALIAVRSHDVLGGGELPLIGMWSAKSMEIGILMNHPGPLFFDALALPAALLRGGAGLIVGATLINGAATVGIFLVARRHGGPLVAMTATTVVAALAWSMGSAVLAEPWTATTILLPFLCLLLLVWGLACGDVACLPWAVFVGSFVLQSNLGYVPFVPVLLGFGGVALAVHLRSGRDAALDGRRQVLRRSLGWTAMVVVLCWIQPVVEQVVGPGEGNLTRLGRGLREPPTGSIDLGRSLSTFAKVVALPPWWGRPSFATAFPFTAFGNPLPPAAGSVGALLALAAVLAWGLRDGWRRQDRPAVMLLATAMVLLAVSLLTAVATPVSESFGTIAYRLRWLWPVGAFVTFALAGTLVGRIGAGLGAAGRRRAGLGLAGLVALFTGLNLPASNQGTTAAAATEPVAQDIVRQLHRADLTGPVLVDCAEGIYDPYCEAVLAELQGRGVAFVVREDGPIRQLGDRRRWTGANAAARLVVVAGDRAVYPPLPAGTHRLALHQGLGTRDQLELFYLQEDIKAALGDGRLRLNERGRRVAARGDLLSVPAAAPGGPVDPDAALAVRDVPFGEHRRDIVALIREDLLAPAPALAARLRRYVRLQQIWDDATVAVVVEPLP